MEGSIIGFDGAIHEFRYDFDNGPGNAMYGFEPPILRIGTNA